MHFGCLSNFVILTFYCMFNKTAFLMANRLWIGNKRLHMLNC